MEDKKQKFLEALMQGYGIIAVACEAVGITTDGTTATPDSRRRWTR
jgi:hypothetical protein